MAEEEKKEAQSGAEQASEAEKEQKQETNWEEKYKAQQKELQDAVERANKADEMLDVVSPHVDWNAISGQGAAKQEQTGDDEGYASKKEVTTSTKNLEASIADQLLAIRFRQDHPELKDYETTLVGPAIGSFRRRYPHEQPQKILDRAAKYANDFLEKERAKGAEEALNKQKEKEEKEDAASGLGSAGSTAPASVSEGQTVQDYIVERRQELAKKKGL